MIKIAVIGAPNVGKSSIVNALVGEQTSIVTGLAGTTRGQIRGYTDTFEIIDTPGFGVKKKDLLSVNMRRNISSAVADADVILYVLDAANIESADIQKIENYRTGRYCDKPFVVAVNKTDRTNFEKLYPRLEGFKKLDFVKAIVPLSAKTGYNVDVLANELKKFNTGGGNSDLDTYTDQSVNKMAAEIIRCSVIKNTRDEIPHGVAVIVTKFTEKTDLTEICADIICEKESHKAILIGKGGAAVKKIGTDSRAEIEKLTGVHVKLVINVVVRPNWKNDPDIFGQI